MQHAAGCINPGRSGKKMTKWKSPQKQISGDSAAPWVWRWKRHYVLFNPPAPLSIHVRILQVTVGVLHHPSPKYEHISGAWFPPPENIPAGFSRHFLKLMNKNINLLQSSSKTGKTLCVKKTSFLIMKIHVFAFLFTCTLVFKLFDFSSLFYVWTSALALLMSWYWDFKALVNVNFFNSVTLLAYF